MPSEPETTVQVNVADAVEDANDFLICACKVNPVMSYAVEPSVVTVKVLLKSAPWSIEKFSAVLTVIAIYSLFYTVKI